MISALLTTLLLVIVGLPIALALPARARHWHALVGEAYLLGAGAATLALLAMSGLGIAWSRFSLFIASGVVITVAAAIAARRRPVRVAAPRLGAANLIDVVTATLAGGHLLLATVAAPIENDYLLIWGVKARMFLAARGIDWAWLEAPLNVPSHPDYPLLVPLLYDVHALVKGGWPEASVGFATFACGFAALLALRGLLADEMPKLARALTTLILMPLLFSPYIGIAEGPLIAYATIGVLYVRRGAIAVGRGSRAEVLTGAVFLGLAAWTKNEGLSLIAVIAIALIVSRRIRLLPALLPAAAIALPWLIVHRMHGLTVDLSEAGAGERMLARLADPIPILSSLFGRSGMPLIFWLGVAVAVAIGFRKLVTEERFLATATVLQLLVYVAVYFMTPRDLTWHIETSWDRVLRQIMPLITLVAIMPTAAVIGSLVRGNNATDS